MTNTFGWPLPETDRLMEDECPYAPPTDPAHNIARRLVMLTHLCFNSDVWANDSKRLKRYWPAMTERIEQSADNPDVAKWWISLTQGMKCGPIKNTMLLHEKNLLTMPTRLSGTSVEDQDVLAIMREYAPHLTDMTRVWAKIRRDAKAAVRNDDTEGV